MSIRANPRERANGQVISIRVMSSWFNGSIYCERVERVECSHHIEAFWLNDFRMLDARVCVLVYLRELESNTSVKLFLFHGGFCKWWLALSFYCSQCDTHTHTHNGFPGQLESNWWLLRGLFVCFHSIRIAQRFVFVGLSIKPWPVSLHLWLTTNQWHLCCFSSC